MTKRNLKLSLCSFRVFFLSFSISGFTHTQEENASSSVTESASEKDKLFSSGDKIGISPSSQFRTAKKEINCKIPTVWRRQFRYHFFVSQPTKQSQNRTERNFLFFPKSPSKLSETPGAKMYFPSREKKQTRLREKNSIADSPFPNNTVSVCYSLTLCLCAVIPGQGKREIFTLFLTTDALMSF